MVTEPQREGDQLTLDLFGVHQLSEGGGAARASSRSPEVPGEYLHSGRESGSGLVEVAGSLRGARPPTAIRAARVGLSSWSLPEYSDAERVRAEIEVLGLDASRHLVSFFEPLLADLGVVRARDLWRQRADQVVMIAGVKVASQTPAVRSGQRIIFLTLDDATGPVDVTIFEKVQPKVARTVFHCYLLAVRGRLRRTGKKGVSIIAEDVWDLALLHRARGQGELARALAGEPGASGPPPRKLWHASGGSAGW